MVQFSHAVFYHIYPLGFCGAPEHNDFCSAPGTGLRRLVDLIPHLKDLGINALYIGPLFESNGHGYDTLDYYWVDRRLGTNDDLADLVAKLHKNGILVILDAVLNHTGRCFFAFKDLQKKGSHSDYIDWYVNLDFNRPSPYGDPFSYEGWNGCYDLVTLNGANPAVREHLFGAVQHWIQTFDLDGLRLDAADKLLPDFMEELSLLCKTIKPHFWLMGEVVHQDYRAWAQEGRLDSVTNYVLYKGLWSSFNDKNFFELAWTLNQQSGPGGIYRDIGLYTFADNHDVDRAASILTHKPHLFPLYGLLFTLPGVPSLYYGSEYGVTGSRTKTSDQALRPSWKALEAARFHKKVSGPYSPAVDGEALYAEIRCFIQIRKSKEVLQTGTYRQIHVAKEQFAFIREGHKEQPILVGVNASTNEAVFTIPDTVLHAGNGSRWQDLLSGEVFTVSHGLLTFGVYPSWLRIMEKV
ncbi:MAG: alpha-amylase [Treponema sp.]|jgi:glycosidase|nr:alpha-amylase [Treponema sp.]